MNTLQQLRDHIALKVVGKEQVIENMIIALLSGGHVLLEDVPGVGKTTLARTLAQSLDCTYARIQFTPDTLPSDITGTAIYHMHDGTFQTVLGPVCHQIVLADEINRTSPKTQSALLEAMAERQVTVDGKTYPIPEPFMVIATENPMESVGTYPLPDSQLDRFMMKLSVGYPDPDATREMARRFLDGRMEEETTAVVSGSEILEAREEVKRVAVDDALVDYAGKIVEETRKHSDVSCGVSPRGLLDLLRAARAKAYVSNRTYVIPEDILEMSAVTLPHRLMLTGEAQMNNVSPAGILRECCSRVKIPE